jgi:hypothetical protein
MAAERSSPHEVRWQQSKNSSNNETGDECGAQRQLCCFSKHFTLGGWSDRVISTCGRGDEAKGDVAAVALLHVITSFVLAFSQRTSRRSLGLLKSLGCDKNTMGCDKNAISFQLAGDRQQFVDLRSPIAVEGRSPLIPRHRMPA